MSRKFRALLVSFSALMAFLIAASAASATLSINPVTTTATAGSTSLIDSTGGNTVACTGANLVDAIASSGSSTINPAAFTGCTNQSGIGLTFTQTVRPWTNRITALLSGGRITGVRIDIIVPSRGAQLAAPLGACTFTISGTQSALVTVTPTTPPALVSVGSIPVSAFGTALGLVIDSVSNPIGACPATLRAGNAARFAGAFTLTPAVTGTLI